MGVRLLPGRPDSGSALSAGAEAAARGVLNTFEETRVVAWGLLVLGLLASAASSLFDLYSKLWWFDEVLHLELVLALTLLVGLYEYGAVLTIAGVGLALGAVWEVWEVWEWAYDQFVQPNAILGKTDTIVDLVMGAVAAGYLCLRVLKR